MVFSVRLQPTGSPDNLIQVLKRGNERHAFLRGGGRAQRERQRASTATESFAVILACADLRIPVEQLFDARPGELYVIQTAANRIGDAEVAGAELAHRSQGVELVIVLGHGPCRVSPSTSTANGKLRTLQTAERLRAGLTSPDIVVAAAFLDEASGEIDFLESESRLSA